MKRATRHIALALAAGGAFFAGLEGSALAGDPDAANEAPTPGPAPALAIWDREIRSAQVEGLDIALDDGALAFSVAEGDGKRFDYDVRCEMVMGSPMARVYVPPMLLSQTRARGELARGEALRVALDLRGVPDERAAERSRFVGAFDTIRVTIHPRGADERTQPLAVLQMPKPVAET